MGRVKYIKSCRKGQKCSKCHAVIPVGGAYYKGELYRARPIVRCVGCGLKSYEVTTSEYVRAVGRLVEDWSENYMISDGTTEEIANALEEIKDVCEESLENMPEQLQDGSDAGQLLQERIDELESAIYELESCGDWNDFLSRGYDELSEEDREAIDKEGENHGGMEYEEWYSAFWESGSEVAGRWKEQTEEAVVQHIEEVLSQLSY